MVFQKVFLRLSQSLFLLCGLVGYAQVPSASYGEVLTINSEVLGEEREIWVYKNEFYDTGAGSYPVLYLLDGESHFGHVCAMVDYLSSALRIPQFIVVGIPNVDRIRDFTPWHSLVGLDGRTDSILFQNTGGGDNFLSFLKDELIPFIDANYRTEPYRILEGHSLGAMFATYVLSKHPSLFNDFILISAGFYGKGTQSLGLLNEFLSNARVTNSIFLSVGSEPRIEPGVDSLMQVLLANGENIEWQFRKYESDDHASVVYPSMHDGIRFLNSEWWIDMNDPDHLPSYGELSTHFKQISAKRGYEVKPTEQFLAYLGFTYLEIGKLPEALMVMQKYVENHPTSSGAFFCLGYAQIENGSREEAIKSFEYSLRLNPNNEGSKSFLEELNGD